MSFNDNYSEKLDEFRTQLVNSLQPQPYLDEFRSSGVMTVQDSEKIMNRYRHSNTASQIGEMLDILKTKGPRGYSIFINVLGIRNPGIYTEMTGKEAPEQPIPLSCNCNCHHDGSGTLPYLEQLTEALKKKEQLEGEVRALKNHNLKLSSQSKGVAEKLDKLWRRYKVEKEKNRDRDRFEEERNEMMEQLTGMTGKALNYKEQLEVATNNLHQSRLEILQLKRELEKANRGLKHQRQRSMQIERSYSHSRTLIKNTEELQEKVARLELELCKADKGESNRASYIQPSSDDNNESTGQVSASNKDSRLIQLQTDLEIMRNDRDEALGKAEDAVSQMYKVTKELHEVEEKLEKLSREKDDLLLSLESQKDEADMQKRFVLLAEDQLGRAVEERNQALEEKNLQTTKCARLMLQRDSLIEQQRALRADMTNLKEKQLVAEAKMVKYKAKLRKKSGQQREVERDGEGDGDDDDYDTSSSGSSEFAVRLNITPDVTDVEQRDEESDRSAPKRDSSTSGTSTNDPTMQFSGDSEDEFRPSLQFRDRTKPLPTRYRDEHDKVAEFPTHEFPSGDPLSAGASTDEDNYQYGIFSSRPTSDSTKGQANRESLLRNQHRLGSITQHGGTRRVKKREKKPSPNSHFKRRSKSFNDLSSVSLEEELDLDLDFDLAFKEESARTIAILRQHFLVRAENPVMV